MFLTRPMLAARARRPEQILFPCLATPKLDGIRCLRVNGSAVSRAFKPIRNRFIAEYVASLPEGVDGELMAGDFNATQSAVMSEDGEPDFQFWCFDCWGLDSYEKRLERVAALTSPRVVQVLPTQLNSMEDFLAFEDECLGKGYEGVVTRSHGSPYKCGRSTLREQWMVKFKRYDDSEATIYDFAEGSTNLNPQVPNAFGLMKRPGGRSGKFLTGTLGAFRVYDPILDTRFEVGTGIGLTQELRQHIWDNKEQYVGRVITYSYQGIGTHGRPRFPSFLRFRDAE